MASGPISCLGSAVILNEELLAALGAMQGTWLVTGAAGFIGSNLVEALLRAGQKVVGLDNFATGHRRNLEELQRLVPEAYASRFEFIEGDIRDRAACAAAVSRVEYVLHQAALGSVPWSMADPLMAHDVNVTGSINLLDAARQANVRRFIYAASSAVYGDSSKLPQQEELIGSPLSPYAATKLINEIYAGVYARSYAFRATGLRYFNVFGPRQDPNGAYAAVIPKWAAAMIRGEEVLINGDGQTTRDFCFVANAIQANIRAALASDDVQGGVFNVALGKRTSLLELFDLLRDGLRNHQVHYDLEPRKGPVQPGDVRHSQADIGKAEHMIGYSPSHSVAQGLTEALPWYLKFYRDQEHQCAIGAPGRREAESR